MAVAVQAANGLAVAAFWMYFIGETDRTCWIRCRCEGEKGVGHNSKSLLNKQSYVDERVCAIVRTHV